ncbi:DUF397 domain-containing protein [Embleya hyalina]|uniref:Toxin n=1 Tax=Embleya hyalina TaxID=516124 RepID=A0A401YHC4_9ACTN|nr:DUF397 domain-containing protein [Embleya hyalina]GCD94015.1 toxin [Embleya hyalina]
MPKTAQLTTAAWRKSTYTNPDGGACVEVGGNFPGIVPVRDSRALAVGHLMIDAASWAALTASLRI